MSGTDTVILGVVLFCGLLGLYWGLIRQVLAVVGLVAGLVLASTYQHEVAAWLSSLVSDDTTARAAAFVLVVVAVSSAASLAATMLRKFFKLIFLGWLDHLAGGLIGLAQGVLICGAGLVVAAALPNPLWMPMLRESQLAGPIIEGTGGLLFSILPESFKLASRMVLGVP
jgi:membrane protein required for colicin V production